MALCWKVCSTFALASPWTPGCSPSSLRTNSTLNLHRSTSNYGLKLKSGFSKHTFSPPRFALSENGQSPEDVIPPGCSRIKVALGKPLGLVLEEDRNGNILVSEVTPDGNAEKSGLINVGDQLIATSAVVYNYTESYNDVKVRKGMEVIRFNVRGERFETVMAAIGSHPGTMKVTVEFQKCEPLSDAKAAKE